MLRITVELLPLGDETRARHLGTAIIANDATGSRARGNYTVRLSKRGQPKSVWRRGRVEGFPRQRLGAWDLLYLALRATVGDRYKESNP